VRGECWTALRPEVQPLAIVFGPLSFPDVSRTLLAGRRLSANHVNMSKYIRDLNAPLWLVDVGDPGEVDAWSQGSWQYHPHCASTMDNCFDLLQRLCCIVFPPHCTVLLCSVNDLSAGAFEVESWHEGCVRGKSWMKTEISCPALRPSAIAFNLLSLPAVGGAWIRRSAWQAALVLATVSRRSSRSEGRK
jgi:hypothetical protein